jgi:hypothetical protein
MAQRHEHIEVTELTGNCSLGELSCNQIPVRSVPHTFKAYPKHSAVA